MRWVHAALVLGTLVLAFVLIGQVATILSFFADLLLILLLAWLLAFMISPLVSLILRGFPRVPRVLVVALIYVVLLVGLSGVTIIVAGSLATSIGSFIGQLPEIGARLPEILAPWQATLNTLGFHVDLVQAANDLLASLGRLGEDLVEPLTQLALASLGLVASLLIVIFLSLFIVLDKDRIVAYLNRLVPPRYKDEARLFETSVASSFGGFIRGQALQGLIMAVIAAVVHVVLGIDFMPASAALAGVLQAIPFFGPVLSWAPPVVVALLTRPEVVLWAVVAMAAGWFIVNNIVLPRVMASAVGIHPVAVLISVLVGLKIAGIAGAIFALPVAAVFAAFFQHFLLRGSGQPRDVASRAARRVEAREGRRIRVPKEPAVAGDPVTDDQRLPAEPTPPADTDPQPEGRA